MGSERLQNDVGRVVRRRLVGIGGGVGVAAGAVRRRVRRFGFERADRRAAVGRAALDAERAADGQEAAAGDAGRLERRRELEKRVHERIAVGQEAHAVGHRRKLEPICVRIHGVWERGEVVDAVHGGVGLRKAG